MINMIDDSDGTCDNIYHVLTASSEFTLPCLLVHIHQLDIRSSITIIDNTVFLLCCWCLLFACFVDSIQQTSFRTVERHPYYTCQSIDVHFRLNINNQGVIRTNREHSYHLQYPELFNSIVRVLIMHTYTAKLRLLSHCAVCWVSQVYRNHECMLAWAAFHKWLVSRKLRARKWLLTLFWLWNQENEGKKEYQCAWAIQSYHFKEYHL